jgi:hypothetical protein
MSVPFTGSSLDYSGRLADRFWRLVRGDAAARMLGRVGRRKRIMTESKVKSAKRLLASGLQPRDVARDSRQYCVTFQRI